MSTIVDLAETVLLSWRSDGFRATARRLRERLFGEEEIFVLVRSLVPPVVPPPLPAVVNGVLVREMTAEDVDTVARILPFDLGRQPLRVRRRRLEKAMPDAFVALRGERIVGACWYWNEVTPEKPWFPAVRDHLVPPSRLTGGIFALPGERAAAWALARRATDCLAARGVRTVVGCIGAKNRPSLLVSRLLGGKIVARQTIRYVLGRARIHVVRVDDRRPFGEP
ncbi:MAG: hypothetical protein KatS3mg076_0011 [Candidatus Binatia bacterium]|nr:MAG: hypothetical protein KatS3mg076_0011 [Candidatus Binatia bacterium]